MNNPERISKNVTYAEATKSQTAARKSLSNDPDEDQLLNMKFVAEAIFEAVRSFVGGPVAITSFFRSESVNLAIGGSTTSQHCRGKAMDLDADVFASNGVTNRDIFFFIKEELEFDQLIWEFGNTNTPGWVHVSHAVDGNNRGQVLRAYRKSGETKYVPFDL